VIVERTGDLFSSDCPAYGHGVNTMGSMGAGISVEFCRRWPDMFHEYQRLCEAGELQPGMVHVYRAPDRTIVNLATQRSYRRGAARLEWVRAAAAEVAKLSLEGLALPRIGAGLGGLRWEDVRVVLEAELAPLPYVELWTRPERPAVRRARWR
jgi:O-acetyl-ADP-ribose deacetylase (regulator of RNase III)